MKYPFTPEILDAMPEELAELYRGLELTLISRICQQLATGKINETTIQNIRILRSHGITLNDIERTITETTGISRQKLEALFDDVVKRNQAFYTELIDKAKLTLPEYIVSAKEIEAIREQTLNEFANLTQSMGFMLNVGGRQVLLPPGEAYQKALDKAAIEVESGAFSYEAAIKKSVKELADSGIKTVQYDSGHIDHIDVAVRRAVMTGVSQICAKYTEQSADFLGTDYFEVSAHMGARDVPGSSPWSSHKEWQGKVYSVRTGDKYPNIYAVCGLGAVDGLEGSNCRHRRWAFVEGVSERTYTDEQLNNIDKPPFKYQGREYTTYQATQKQRQIERTVRRLKRQQAAFKAAGLAEDEQAVSTRIRRLNQEYKAFSSAAGLPLQRERMKAQYPDELTDIKRFAPLKEYPGQWTIKDKFSERQYVTEVGKPQITGTTQHFWDNLSGKPDRAGLNVKAAQDIINNSKLTLYQTDRQTLKFISDNGYAVIRMDKKLITVVPEKLRKKYKKYLEEK